MHIIKHILKPLNYYNLTLCFLLTGTLVVAQQSNSSNIFPKGELPLLVLPNLADSSSNYTQLDLSHQQIRIHESSDWFRLLKKDTRGNYIPSPISHINLSHNNINKDMLHFPKEYFPMLKVLDLSHNKIRCLILMGDDKLQSLNVSHNELKSLFISPWIDSLDLSHNPSLTGEQLVWKNRISNINLDGLDRSQLHFIGKEGIDVELTDEQDETSMVEAYENQYLKEVLLDVIISIDDTDKEKLAQLPMETLMHKLDSYPVSINNASCYFSTDSLLQFYQVETQAGAYSNIFYDNFLHYNDQVIPIPASVRFYEIKDIFRLTNNSYLVLHHSYERGSPANYFSEIAHADVIEINNGQLHLDTIEQFSYPWNRDWNPTTGIYLMSEGYYSEVSHDVDVILRYDPDSMKLHYKFSNSLERCCYNDSIWDVSGYFEYFDGAFSKQTESYSTYKPLPTTK